MKCSEINPLALIICAFPDESRDRRDASPTALIRCRLAGPRGGSSATRIGVQVDDRRTTSSEPSSAIARKKVDLRQLLFEFYLARRRPAGGKRIRRLGPAGGDRLAPRPACGWTQGHPPHLCTLGGLRRGRVSSIFRRKYAFWGLAFAIARVSGRYRSEELTCPDKKANRSNLGTRTGARTNMRPILNGAFEWLDRAEQAREVVGQLTDPGARKAVLELAEVSIGSPEPPLHPPC